MTEEKANVILQIEQNKFIYRRDRKADSSIERQRVVRLRKKRDYYEILGVGKNADGAAIKKAYRKMVKQYHPDSNRGNPQAEEKFKEITEAYDILSDEKKRKLYDRFGHAAFEDGGTGAEAYGQSADPFGSMGGGAYREYHFEGGQDVDDLLKDLFGGAFGGGNFHGDPFRRDGFQDFGMNGEDLHAQVELTFEEVAFGGTKTIRLKDERGSVQSLEVKIPAGIESGKTIRLSGRGMPGAGGGKPGDLLLKVTVQEKPGFRREGMDVYTTARIPFTTAVFGGEVRIQTIYGEVLCKIKEGTQPGTKIRLKGKGIAAMKNPSQKGDQYTTIEIRLPDSLSPEAAQKLREFEQLQKKQGFQKGHVA